jgi:acyl-CoA thioester hydrolase
MMPTADQVEELSAQIRAKVPEEYLDRNGHMSTVRYVDLAGQAMGVLWTAVGMGWTDNLRHGRGIFMLDLHMRYLAELRRGEEYSTHVRLLDRSDKVLHSVVFMLDQSSRRVACTAEMVAICMDLERRETSRFPVHVGAALDADLSRHAALGWVVPAGGQLGVRHTSRDQ